MARLLYYGDLPVEYECDEGRSDRIPKQLVNHMEGRDVEEKEVQLRYGALSGGCEKVAR